MTEPTSPVCTACGVEWFHHGGMPHDFEHPTESPPPTLTEIYAAQELAAEAGRGEFATDMAAGTMVRAYTEEIEAHRLTRERAEKAERQLAEEREWFAIARRGLDEKDARLAELVRRTREELEYWRDMRTIGNATHAGFDKLLKEFGDKYGGGEHG